jgi:preprotein translocase subunit SecB
MAKKDADAAQDSAAQQQPVMPQMKILGQFVRDLSFENIAAQKSVQGAGQPDIQLRVALDGGKRPTEKQYDVIVKVTIEAKTKGDAPEPIFRVDLDYAGIFHIDNVPEEQLHPYLMIECPRMLFPFIRRIVSDVTRDGGYLPLNLDTIDFVALYRNELARKMTKQKADA